MKFTRSSRTSRMPSRVSTEVGEHSKSNQQSIRRTITDSRFDTHKGAVRKFRKGTSGTDQSHADQVREAGSLRIEQDFTLVAWIERIIHPKFWKNGRMSHRSISTATFLTSSPTRCFLFGWHGYRMQSFHMGHI